MKIDNETISIIAAAVSTLGVLVETVVHWDKIRAVLFSSVASFVARTALLFACFWFGPWAIVAGVNVYLLLVFADFVRVNDNSCAAVGSAILASAIGVFSFAIQYFCAVQAAQALN